MPEEHSAVEIEMRKEERKEVSEPASFSCSWMEENGPAHLESEGKIANLSETGLSLYTDVPVHSGVEIKISSSALGEEGISGTVIWCNKLEKKHYQIGISVNNYLKNQHIQTSTE